ncbi:MAG: tetraacyldisaccharide 4'-kinase, partial [Gemmatimonadaceae bacterium]
MADRRQAVERIWRARGKRARAVRALLTPAELLYGAIVSGRGKLYDWGLFRSEEFSVPVLSVGNLTVGGTGKT